MQSICTLVVAAVAGICNVNAQSTAAHRPAWSGFYIGTHVGLGTQSNTLTDRTANWWSVRANDSFRLNNAGIVGGIQAGYLHPLAAGFVGGFEFAGSLGRLTEARTSPFYPASDRFKAMTSNRIDAGVKVGYDAGRYFPYIRVGYGGAQFKFKADSTILNTRLYRREWLSGVVLGGGMDYALTERIRIGMEYSYTHFGTRALKGVTRNNQREWIDLDSGLHAVSVRLNVMLAPTR